MNPESSPVPPESPEADRYWFQVRYDVLTGIDGWTVSSADVLVGVPSDDPRGERDDYVGDRVVAWAHDNDRYADPRVSPRIRIASVDPLESAQARELLLAAWGEADAATREAAAGSTLVLPAP